MGLGPRLADPARRRKSRTGKWRALGEAREETRIVTRKWDKTKYTEEKSERMLKATEEEMKQISDKDVEDLFQCLDCNPL